MRVLVCGGRYFNERGLLTSVMDELHAASPITAIIHGAAGGADTLARDWAVSRGIHAAAFPAEWKAFHEAAGPIRNAYMLVAGKPELVVAFPGGRGTSDMVAKARKAGVDVREVSV
jgi:hypothetical protein